MTVKKFSNLSAYSGTVYSKFLAGNTRNVQPGTPTVVASNDNTGTSATVTVTPKIGRAHV